MPTVASLGTSLIKEDTTPAQGYVTKELKEPYQIPSAGEYAVILEFNNKTGDPKNNPYVSYEWGDTGSNPIFDPSSDGSNSWMSAGGNWTNLGTYHTGDYANCGSFSIKADLVKKESALQSAQAATKTFTNTGNEIEINFNLNDNKIESLLLDDSAPLMEGSDYTVTGGKVTLSVDFVTKKLPVPFDSKVFVYFSSGEPIGLTIKAFDISEVKSIDFKEKPTKLSLSPGQSYVFEVTYNDDEGTPPLDSLIFSVNRGGTIDENGKFTVGPNVANGTEVTVTVRFKDDNSIFDEYKFIIEIPQNKVQKFFSDNMLYFIIGAGVLVLLIVVIIARKSVKRRI